MRWTTNYKTNRFFLFNLIILFSLSVSAAVLIKSQPTMVKVTATGAGNWAARISGPGVVWYHNFDSAAEVNQFRWTNGYQGGQDPLSKGSGGNLITWQASGGADGGAYMRQTYPLGDVAGRGGSYWARPFNPLTAATTGRGAADPGANGTIPLAEFTVSDGSSTLYDWGKTANPGWYGHPTHQAANPSKFQGNDFYLQVRGRRPNTPGSPPPTEVYTCCITGKFVWLTTTVSSYTAQELVTYGQSDSDVVGKQSRHNVYVGQNFSSIGEQGTGSTNTISNLNLNWRYSGGWDTLLYHITPGTNGGTGTNRTRVEIWAQHDITMFPAESGQYTKIWDTTFTIGYDGGSNSSGSPGLQGWNALLLATYHNGSAFNTTAFTFDYDQVIFSKNTIPAPTK